MVTNSVPSLMLPVVNLGIFLKEKRQHWVGKYDRKIGETGSK
jgi:hypothetical protein